MQKEKCSRCRFDWDFFGKCNSSFCIEQRNLGPVVKKRPFLNGTKNSPFWENSPFSLTWNGLFSRTHTIDQNGLFFTTGPSIWIWNRISVNFRFRVNNLTLYFLFSAGSSCIVRRLISYATDSFFIESSVLQGCLERNSKLSSKSWKICRPASWTLLRPWIMIWHILRRSSITAMMMLEVKVL